MGNYIMTFEHETGKGYQNVLTAKIDASRQDRLAYFQIYFSNAEGEANVNVSEIDVIEHERETKRSQCFCTF